MNFEENKRGNRGLPNRRHFKFFYNSSLSNKEESILLDIVLEDTAYIPFTKFRQIKSDLFEIETELEVKIPTIEGLLGDKLTAFAPHTIGVPFITAKGDSMTMQVVKQLYDIGELFDVATEFDKITTAFTATFEKENEYRGNKFTKAQVLQNAIDTCLALLQIRLKGFKSNKISNYLEEGIRKIDSHLLNDNFKTDEKAKITASKVFCIANRIFNNKTFDLIAERYGKSKIGQIKNIKISEPYERFNRLKPVLPEAFYYVWQGIKE